MIFKKIIPYLMFSLSIILIISLYCLYTSTNFFSYKKYDNEILEYRGINIYFDDLYNIKKDYKLEIEMKEVNVKLNINKKKILNEIKKQIDLQYEIYDLDENYFNNMNLVICNCFEFENDKVNTLGLNSFYDNLIIITLNYDSEKTINTLSHEFGHYHYNFINQHELLNYAKKYHNYKGNIEELFYYDENIKWKNRIEEKIVEDIKTITVINNANKTNGKKIKEKQKYLLKEIILDRID